MRCIVVRSERQFCEQLEYNLLYRWFLDMDLMEPAFDASTFSRNRRRMLDADIAGRFFRAIRDQGAEMMSREHFSVDGTLIEAWASIKSFRPKDDDSGDNNGWGDFRGQKRSNQTHQSKTDPQARLMRKGPGTRGQIVIWRPCIGGKPAWTAGRIPRKRSQRPQREASSYQNAQAKAQPPNHCWCR